MIKLFSTITMILLLWLTPDYNTSKPKEKTLTLKQQEKEPTWVTGFIPDILLSDKNTIPSEPFVFKFQEKEYTVKATLQEWILITSPQDDVPKNARDNFIKKIASQLQPQLAQDTIPKKK